MYEPLSRPRRRGPARTCSASTWSGRGPRWKRSTSSIPARMGAERARST